MEGKGKGLRKWEGLMGWLVEGKEVGLVAVLRGRAKGERVEW